MSSVEAALQNNDALLQDSKDIKCGGWVPIENINDPYVQEIGRFAVMEHDKISGDDIIFMRVSKGWTGVVAGVLYRLVIEATRKGDNCILFYEAEVWDKPWESIWTLTSFKPLLKV